MAAVTKEQREKADAAVLRAARRRKTPFTAAELGTTAARLRHLGAVEVGHVQTGKRGRPAVLFQLQSQQS